MSIPSTQITFRSGFAGRITTVEVNGATPGQIVYLIAGGRTGSTNVPGCVGVSVDIRKPLVVGKKKANVNGNVTDDVMVLKAVRGLTILTQAVEIAECHVSNLDTFTFPK